MYNNSRLSTQIDTRKILRTQQGVAYLKETSMYIARFGLGMFVLFTIILAYYINFECSLNYIGCVQA